VRTVSLVGLAGSGKSEVGRVLARRLGWQVVDTDAEIVAREGRSIPAIFSEAGEAHFRAVEQAVVRQAAGGRERVIATGGGAILSEGARRALGRAGPVFYLRAPVEVLLARLGSDSARPLLGADPRAALERLLGEREALYSATGVPVDAAQPVEAVADEVLARLAGAARRVRVELGARSYDVLVGSGLRWLAGFTLRRLGAQGRVAVVTHPGLARRFGAGMARGLEGSGFSVHTVTVRAGERAKSLRQVGRIVDALSASGFSRPDTIVALGGGVVGDLAGFVAGTYMRGVRLVQVPTTLLAQLDSGIGGKAAVNHPRAKNLIGLYHQPALVIADTETLASLPVRERRAGLAEAIKCGVVLDRDLFGFLEENAGAATRAGSLRILEEVVFRCAALKARIVSEDEHERGLREILNYGHTVGHAIEAAFPGLLVHGEAVAVGMRVEARLAVRLGILDQEAADRQDTLLARLRLDAPVPAGPMGPLLDAMRLDKKQRGGRIRCTLPEGIGRARLGVEVPDSLMEEVVAACQRP
jgi:3-dehydroquinate synthase